MADTQTWLNIDSVEDFTKIPNVPDPVSEALQSQYAHSQIYNRFNRIINSELDATKLLDAVLREVADTDTANGVFLDWWGDRVGVSREIKVGGDYQRFDDDFFRFLVKYRALANISAGNAYAINELLERLTGSTVFVVDYQDMSINSIVVIGDLSDLDASILASYGLLNRPAGVLANMLVIYPDEQIFGFEGSGLLPFNVGVFNPSRTVEMNSN